MVNSPKIKGIENQEFYIIKNNTVLDYILVTTIGDKAVLVPKNDIVIVDSSELFDKRLDALYENFKKQIVAGKPISQFKRSKYYKYYIQTATQKNPELLIF